MALPLVPIGARELLDEAEKRNETKVAQQLNGATTSGSATVPAIGFWLLITVPDAATGDVDRVLTRKHKVLDAVVYKRGGAGGAANTVQIKNGTNAISDAIDINIADNTRAVPATLDDAQQDIAAGGTLRVTRTKAGGNAACDVLVLLAPVA